MSAAVAPAITGQNGQNAALHCPPVFDTLIYDPTHVGDAQLAKVAALCGWVLIPVTKTRDWCYTSAQQAAIRGRKANVVAVRDYGAKFISYMRNDCWGFCIYSEACGEPSDATAKEVDSQLAEQLKVHSE